MCISFVHHFLCEKLNSVFSFGSETFLSFAFVTFFSLLAIWPFKSSRGHQFMSSIIFIVVVTVTVTFIIIHYYYYNYYY